MKKQLWGGFYLAAAVYDGLIGALFLLAPGLLFERCGVIPPNHMGYVQFPAALLLIFAIMFVVIALDPQKNRGLIPYGILLKISYCGVVLRYWMGPGIPDMWKPFAQADAIFLVIFIISFISLKPRREA